MKYAKEVIDLLAAYPGRRFRMIHIVRHVAGGQPDAAQWERIRKGVRRVIEHLEHAGHVARCEHAKGSGGFSLYAWKPGHELFENRD